MNEVAAIAAVDARASQAATSAPVAPEAPAVVPACVRGQEILSGPGGKFEVNPDLRRFLVLTNEGLFVSNRHQFDHGVLGFIERLKKAGLDPRTQYVPIDEITNAYRGRAAARSGSGEAIDGEQGPVIELLREGLGEDASDLHFIISGDGCDVRFRVLGELETKHGFSREKGMRMVSALYNSMCDVASQTFNANASQRARLKADYTRALGLYGARVQTRPTHDGLLMVLRLLKSDDTIMTHEQLGFLPQQIDLMDELAACPFGVSLISGPTGSGKSRTLQSTMWKILNDVRFTENLITIEDPPEYPIRGAVVTPLQVADRNKEGAVSRAWQESVSEAMRLDPDVIMVGEVSDLGSARTCLSAAKTGHGVWSTLHSNDATSIPKRLIDMSVDPADVLDPTLMIGFTAQRLLPELCPHCKVRMMDNAKRLRAMTYTRLQKVTPVDMMDGIYLRGDGCDKCKGRGILRRRPVIEVVRSSLKFMEEFEAGGALRARRYWVSHGGITMLRHALHHVWNGLIDPVDAEAVQPLDNDLNTLGANYAEQGSLV